MRNSICMLSFLLHRIFLYKKMCDWSDRFGGLFLYQACSHFSILVKTFRDFNVFSLYIFKTSMSPVFTFQDFNVFSLYISRLQCLLSFTFQDFNVFSLYIYKTSMSSVFYISRLQCLQSLYFKTSMSSILLCKTTTLLFNTFDTSCRYIYSFYRFHVLGFH